MPHPTPRFWPWGRRAALLAAVLLLLSLLVLIVVSRQLTTWPADGDIGSIVLAALIVALVPIALMIADGIAAGGGSIGVAGVTLSFAATSQRVAATVPTATLSQNLGTAEGAVVQSSSLTSILDALRNAHRSDVTVVDLDDGRRWWHSRLFILIAGAAQRDRPRAIAFVGSRNGRQRGQFLGWATPQRLMEAQLAASADFREHYARAQAETAQWSVGTPAGSGPGGQPTVILPWGGQKYLPTVTETRADPAFALELYLQQALDSDAVADLQLPVSATRLGELYGAELVTDSADVSDSPHAWVALLTQSHEDWFALTDGGRFRGLVPRYTLVAALLAQMLELSGAVDSSPS